MEHEEITTQSYVLLTLADEIFAINVHKVLEVLEYQHITKVPQAPDFISGVINFRDEILPVINTRMKFNLPQVTASNKNVIVVLDLKSNDNEVLVGAIADGVSDVIEVSEQEIKPIPKMGFSNQNEYLNGMFRRNDNFVMILNADKLFTNNEINELQLNNSEVAMNMLLEQE